MKTETLILKCDAQQSHGFVLSDDYSQAAAEKGQKNGEGKSKV